MIPTAYLQKLDGKSNAHLIQFNDGKEYAVKFFQEGFEKSLPNEWVGYCLGRYLGLPIPFAKIIEIPEEFINQVPELAGMNLSKYQFASQYIPNCLDGHHVDTVSSITNTKSLASIILFDYWLCNYDRTRKNILLQEQAPETYELFVIDQAEVFGGYSWSLEDIETLPVGIIKSAAHELIAAFIETEEEFYEQLELIQTIPILLMEEIVSVIPDDWNVSKDEKKAMVTTLLQRRKSDLPGLVNRFIKKVYHPLRDQHK